MDSLYYVVYKNGTLRMCSDESALRECLADAKTSGLGVQVYYGIAGEFSSDGAKFKCGSLEIDLTEEVSWNMCSKEWYDGK